MQFRFAQVAIVVGAIGLATAGCGKYSISNIRSLKAFQDATVLYKKADYRNAIPLYEESVKRNPDLGFAYFFLGNSHDNLYKTARKGEPENDAHLQRAVENYQLAIQKLSASTDPKEQDIRKYAFQYLIAAYGHDKLDDFSKAEPVAMEMIKLEPNEPINYQALAKLYEDQGRYDDAETWFKKAIDVRPNDALGYQMLAGFYNRQGDFDKTVQAFNERAAREPNNPEAWHTIGTYVQDKVQRDKTLSKEKQREYVLMGLQNEDKALALNPEYFEALTYKNILLRMQANVEKDPAKQKALMAEADELKAKAIEIQKKQQAAAADKPAEKKPGGK